MQRLSRHMLFLISIRLPSWCLFVTCVISDAVVVTVAKDGLVAVDTTVLLGVGVEQSGGSNLKVVVGVFVPIPLQIGRSIVIAVFVFNSATGVQIVNTDVVSFLYSDLVRLRYIVGGANVVRCVYFILSNKLQIVFISHISPHLEGHMTWFVAPELPFDDLAVLWDYQSWDVTSPHIAVAGL